MNIFLTYDYELFFGESTGTIEKCLIEPTNELLRLGKKHQVCMTFFVDVGYLIKLEHYSESFPNLKKDLLKIKFQLQELLANGHDIQLHVHPHWEKSTYENGKWNIVTKDVYKLDDFSDSEIVEIMARYKAYLDNLIGYSTSAFRAGGWCIQPFNRLEKVFEKLGLKYDSSVFPGGKFISGEYSFDFTKAPQKSHYRFTSDECAEDENGKFTEYPISSWRYSPLFYWRLYILGRLFPNEHKMIGDGTFLAQPGRKKSVLTSFTQNHVSTDGYYASVLSESLKAYHKKGHTDFVIIGHPKGMTKYSLKTLDNFLKQTHTKNTFTTFRKLQ